jgi:PEP-CTERM motif
MTRRIGVAALVSIAFMLATVRFAGATTIWTFTDADLTGTPVSGFLTFGNFTSSAPGTIWQVSDITDFSINYNGSEIASFANSGFTTFFSDAAGIPILEFTATTPFLPFVSTAFGDFRSLLSNSLAADFSLILLIEGSTTGQTFLDCQTNVLPFGTPCNGAAQDLVPIVWTASTSTSATVPEPSSLVLMAIGLSSLSVRRRRSRLHRDQSQRPARFGGNGLLVR